MPRCLSSLRTCIQNLAPSLSWNHIPICPIVSGNA